MSAVKTEVSGQPRNRSHQSAFEQSYDSAFGNQCCTEPVEREGDFLILCRVSDEGDGVLSKERVMQRPYGWECQGEGKVVDNRGRTPSASSVGTRSTDFHDPGECKPFYPLGTA